MSTQMTEDNQTFTKEQAVAKIKEILANEKFKMDAYFFCGFPSGTPNEKLLKACENYLKAAEQEKPDPDAAAALIAELEAAAADKPNTGAADNLVNNTADLREVLAHRELLLG